MCLPLPPVKLGKIFNSGNRIKVGSIAAPNPAIAEQAAEGWCPATETRWGEASAIVNGIPLANQFTDAIKRTARQALSYRDPTQNDICPGYTKNTICLTIGGTESLSELFHCRPCQAFDSWISIEANWNGKKKAFDSAIFVSRAGLLLILILPSS